MEIYTRKEFNENTFEVLGSDGSTLKNYNGKPFPILFENISRNLNLLKHKTPHTKELNIHSLQTRNFLRILYTQTQAGIAL
jgi:hypothetical protein